MKNQVQLITYPDSLGGDLPTLRRLLETHFPGAFSGIHLLPPYPSSGDRGFAPRTYFEIEPSFGTWEDVRQLAGQYEVLVDVMVNHLSRSSPEFRDFAAHGRASSAADLFLTLDKVWPGGDPPPADVARIFLRRPEHPFAEIPIADTGAVERVWATFGARDWSEQIDLDVHSPQTQAFFRRILAHLGRQGIRLVRLDAIAYVIKKPGTSCFFVEPEIYAFLDWFKTEAAQVGIELLLEVHAEASLQRRLAGHGAWVYNFALPLLVLHTLQTQDSRALQAHLANCPPNQVTLLDCHDGIPVQPDLDGLLSVDEAEQVVQTCLARGANLSRILSPAHQARPGFDAHQINVTYFSALGADADAYLAARAIQFFAPGVPQVYYVGLLAGENDPDAVERTGERRAINRHNYTAEEVEAATHRPVVARLLDLIRFRNTCPAFGGEFVVQPSAADRLHLAWRNGKETCTLEVDLNTMKCLIEQHLGDGSVRRFEP